MTVTYEDVNPSLIENTTMQKMFIDGVHRVYTINANEGYALHDVNYDVPATDEITGEETGEVILGFRPPASTATCGYNYDFTENPRGFYDISENELPENAEIYGSTNEPEHEIM